jgi:hypothetical protein
MQYLFVAMLAECLDIKRFRINNGVVALQHNNRRLLKRNILSIVSKGVSR